MFKALRNNYTGSQENTLLVDDKDRARDASFNVEKLAENLVDQIQHKNKRTMDSRQTDGIDGSSSRDQNMSYQAANKSNISELKRRSLKAQNYSPDSRARHHSNSSKENYDQDHSRDNFYNDAHRPVVRKNYHQQKNGNQLNDTQVSHHEKESHSKQLREKLRGMLQNKKMTNNYLETSYQKMDQSFQQSNYDGSTRNQKRPRDISVTNDIFNESMRSELRSIGNPTNSNNPYILDDLFSNGTQKRPNSSVYSTPKEEIGKIICLGCC